MSDARILNSSIKETDTAVLADGRISVALLSPSWPPGYDANGIVPYIGAIAPELEARGHVVSILSAYMFRDEPSEGVYNLEHYREDRTLVDRLFDRLALLRGNDHVVERWACRLIATAARRAIDDRGVQLLEMEETFGRPLSVRPRIPIPIVARLHGPWFLNGPANGQPADAAFRARVRKEGLALAAVEGVTAPSLDVLERTRSYYGIALEHAEVIPPPVPDVLSKRSWNPRDCEPEEILFIGRFDRHKGGDLIIDAFRRVLERRPRARLKFVGLDRGFVDETGRKWTIRQYTEDRIPGAWQRGQVEWLDRQTPPALADLRLKAAVTVVCSRYETFGLTATEAMCQGCPLVVTGAGALAEIVQDGINGLVCRPDDPSDLASKICLLLENPPLAERLAQRAAVDGRQRYNPRQIAVRLEDYYRRVMARTRAKQ